MRIERKHLAAAAPCIWLSAILLFLPTASGQGFINLNFEQASIASAPPGYTPSDAYDPISATDALPGWSVYEDSTLCTALWGEPVALDETSVALVYGSYSPIQGSYSVQLTAYADAPAGLYRSSSIEQTGFIPAGTESIQFLIASPPQAGSVPPDPMVTVNGAPVGLSVMSESSGVITMGGDVSAFAGEKATLAFLCQATTGGTFPSNENYFNLDDIQFSTSPVPEPGTIALCALGGLSLVCRWRKKSSA